MPRGVFAALLTVIGLLLPATSVRAQDAQPTAPAPSGVSAKGPPGQPPSGAGRKAPDQASTAGGNATAGQGDATSKPPQDATGTLKPDPEIPLQDIIKQLGEPMVWLLLLLVFVFGLLGSLAYELVKYLSPPAAPTVPAPANPGAAIAARVLLGGFAAVAVLYILKPQNLISLISLSIIAGSMGTALFNTLQERLALVTKNRQLAGALATAQNHFTDIQRQAPPPAPVLPGAEPQGHAANFAVITSLAASGERIVAEALQGPGGG